MFGPRNGLSQIQPIQTNRYNQLRQPDTTNSASQIQPVQPDTTSSNNQIQPVQTARYNQFKQPDTTSSDSQIQPTQTARYNQFRQPDTQPVQTARYNQFRQPDTTNSNSLIQPIQTDEAPYVICYDITLTLVSIEFQGTGKGFLCGTKLLDSLKTPMTSKTNCCLIRTIQSLHQEGKFFTHNGFRFPNQQCA